MSEYQISKRRVSYLQLQNLWEFLNCHKDLARGYNKSAQARDNTKRMWVTAASILNAAGEGAVKSGPEWSKYWVDYKAKLKRKNRLNRDSRIRTGGGPPSENELSEIEIKFLQILGDDYGSGLPGVQVEPFGVQGNILDLTQSYSEPSQEQPTEGSEEAIYLQIDSDEYTAVVHNEADSIGDQTEICPSPQNQPSTSAGIQPLPATAPSAIAQGVRPPSVQSGVIRNGRRRRRQRPFMTAREARQQLVAASQARAEAEIENRRSLERAVAILSDIAQTLRQIHNNMI